MSPGTEGHDMPAAAAPPAPAPPALAAAATAPSPEALGTLHGAARPRGGAIMPPRPGFVGARRGSAGSGALSALGACGREVSDARVRIPGLCRGVRGRSVSVPAADCAVCGAAAVGTWPALL